MNTTKFACHGGVTPLDDPPGSPRPDTIAHDGRKPDEK